MNRTGIASLIGSERPGYSRGASVYEMKNKERLDNEFIKNKSDFFRTDIDGNDTIKTGKPPLRLLLEYGSNEDGTVNYDDMRVIDISQLNKEKLLAGKQDFAKFDKDRNDYFFIDYRDPDYDTFTTFGFDNRIDHRAFKNKERLDEGIGTLKTYGKILAGKPFKEDIGILNAAKEYAKATGRTVLGGAKVLPESLAAAYRFVMPAERLGGVGPIDTFSEEGMKRSMADDYYLPGYSDLFGAENAGKGVFPEFLMPDQSLYQPDDKFDEMMQLSMGFDRDDINEQIGAIGLGNLATLGLAASGPIRSATQLARLKNLNKAIDSSKALRTMDNPIAQIAGGVTGDLIQDGLEVTVPLPATKME